LLAGHIADIKDRKEAAKNIVKGIKFFASDGAANAVKAKDLSSNEDASNIICLSHSANGVEKEWLSSVTFFFFCVYILRLSSSCLYSDIC
jgi:hypothetical protein